MGTLQVLGESRARARACVYVLRKRERERERKTAGGHLAPCRSSSGLEQGSLEFFFFLLLVPPLLSPPSVVTVAPVLDMSRG